jgi:ABC-type phosphate/phosphonate transport system substrate-binding protein
MYDVPELAVATDRLWAVLADAFEAEGVAEVPRALDRERDHRDLWRDPALLLSQTCGYPLVRELAGRVRIVATPRYHVAECVGAFYTSRVVVRKDAPFSRLADLAGACCAANEIGSHSGMNAFRALVAPLAYRRGGRFFSRVAWSGGHRASLEMVASGEVDAACVDSVSFALTARVVPELTSAVREIARTAPCPGLPLITAGTTSDDDLARMRRALERVFADPATSDVRRQLLLDGIEILPEGAYRTVLDLEGAAAALGYAELA